MDHAAPRRLRRGFNLSSIELGTFFGEEGTRVIQSGSSEEVLLRMVYDLFGAIWDEVYVALGFALGFRNQ